MSRFPAAQFLLSVASPAQFPEDLGAEVAFAGRSNAGKSSAINAIVERHALARTGKTPGQTKLLNYFQLAGGARLVDLPGYGYAAVAAGERRQWVPLLERLRRRESLQGLFLVVDARRGLGDGDRQLMDWVDPARRRVHVLLTKADKLGSHEARRVLEAAGRELGAHASVQLFSAQDRTGVRAAQDALLELLGSAGTDKKPR